MNLLVTARASLLFGSAGALRATRSAWSVARSESPRRNESVG
jgi:hypothetical protein